MTRKMEDGWLTASGRRGFQVELRGVGIRNLAGHGKRKSGGGGGG